MPNSLAELSLLQIKEENKGPNSSTFIVEPLAPGFGLTVANSLRRVLLSSLGGAAITSIRIDGVTHEFSTIKGVRQDVVDMILNLKQIRIKLDGKDSQVIFLDIKNKKQVKAGDFKCPTGVTIINKDLVIADVIEGGKLLIEATVERGRGYLSTEIRREDKLPIGVIAIDASFSPIERVNFQVENTRVGKMTNFDKLILEIDTGGTQTPREALEGSAKILVDHFAVISGQVVNEISDETVDSVQTEDLIELVRELEAPKVVNKIAKKVVSPSATPVKKSVKNTAK